MLLCYFPLWKLRDLLWLSISRQNAQKNYYNAQNQHCCCCSIVSDSLWPHRLQRTRLLCPSLCPWDCSNSSPSSQWHHQTISSSVVPFSCLQLFPAPGSFPVSWLFTSDGRSIGASASASVFAMNIQGWFPLGLTGLIVQSKELSRVFSNTTIRKHQFFGIQLFLWYNSHIHTRLMEKP